MDNLRWHHRNRPALTFAVLLGGVGLIGISASVTFAARMVHSGLSTDAAASLALLVSAASGGIGAVLFFMVRDTEIDGAARAVRATFALCAWGMAPIVFSEERWPLDSVDGVGIHFVFRGPARVFLVRPGGLLHLATFYFRDRLALDLGAEMSRILGLPLIELDGHGAEKRRLRNPCVVEPP